MQKNLTGQYVPGSSPLHRLDARAKFFSFLFLIAAVVAAHSIFGCLAVIGSTAALVWLSRLPARLVLGAVTRLSGLYLVIFLMNAFFYSTENAIWSWWIFTFSVEGMRQGLNVIFRIVPVMVCSNVLTQTTQPLEITAAIRVLLRPLKLLRLPADDVAMILSAAMQFIPTLFEETDTIKKAQIARGAGFESRKLHERALALIPMVVPIFLAAFKRADELAMAMEARGYRGGAGRTKRREKPMNAAGWAALGGCAVFCMLVIIF